MQRRFRAAAWCAAAPVRLVSRSGLRRAVRAQQPDFTGVWTTYNEPGPGAAGGGRGGGPPLPMTDARSRKCRSIRRWSSRPATRRAASASARHARIDARLGRLSDGDHPAARADHDRLRGAQRGSPRLSRRPDRARSRPAAGPQRSLERPLGRQHARRRDGASGRAGRSAIRAQRQGEDRRALSPRQRARRARPCSWPR